MNRRNTTLYTWHMHIYILYLCTYTSIYMCAFIPVFCLVSLTEQIHIEPVCDCHRHCGSYWSRTSLLPPDLLSRYELHPAQSLLPTVSYPFVNYSAPLFFLLQPQAFFTVHLQWFKWECPSVFEYLVPSWVGLGCVALWGQVWPWGQVFSI